MRGKASLRADHGCQLCWIEDGVTRVAGFRVGPVCLERVRRIAAAEGMELFEQDGETLSRRVRAQRPAGRRPRLNAHRVARA